ncbi:hypothetical protein ACFL7D_10615 [candidate division KSB1 bacterium]
MFRKLSVLLVLVFIISTITGCATFRSELDGVYDQATIKNTDSGKVKVLFILRHVRQAEGLDAIPKLDRQNQIIRDFDDLFLDAIKEFSNIESYDTYVEYSSDVHDPDRRARKKQLINRNDFIIEYTYERKYSFVNRSLGTTFSVLTLTLIPIPSSVQYTFNANVLNNDEELIKSFTRTATLKTWTQMFLIFAQPFHNEDTKKEQVYIEAMHDIFRQIETEKILSK